MCTHVRAVSANPALAGPSGRQAGTWREEAGGSKGQPRNAYKPIKRFCCMHGSMGPGRRARLHQWYTLALRGCLVHATYTKFSDTIVLKNQKELASRSKSG